MQQLKQVSRFTSNKNNDEAGLRIDIDEETIENLMYLVTDINNPYRSKKMLRNVYSLIDKMDLSVYDERPMHKLYLQVITSIIDCYLYKDITTPSILQSEITEEYPESKKILRDFFSDIDDGFYNNEALLENDISRYLCKYIEDRLTYYSIFKIKDQLQPIFDMVDEYDTNLSLINQSYTKIIERAYADCMKNKMEEENSMDDFSSSDDSSADKIIERTIESYQNPNNRVHTGIKLFDKMLSGGFENGRFYLACGLPKSFKSGLLLECLVWACKYNKFDDVEEDKKPVVFYLTMENSVRETINRLYLILTGKSIKEYTLVKAKKLLYKEFLDKTGVGIEIKYRANKTISTLDFDNMITDIETEGKKVVFAIQDYTKRIRSSHPDKELRLELANVSDDFCTIAKRRNIPILSAAQLNRVAMQEVEKYTQSGGKDIAKLLNSSHIGESSGLIENADCSFTLFKEVVAETDECYLAIKLLVSREEYPEVTYFAQRFVGGIHSLQLEEDLDLDKSLSVTSIAKAATDNFNPNDSRTKVTKRRGGRVSANLEYYDEGDDDDIDFEEDDNEIEDKASKRVNEQNPTPKKRTKNKSKKVKNFKSRSSTSNLVTEEDEELLNENEEEFS